MADDEPEENAPEAEGEGDDGNGEGEEKSFRERVEEIRQQRAEEREGEGGEGEDPRERMEEMMGGGGPPGMGGGPGGGGPGGMGGGNPFAQMMGGMMGGGGPGGALGGEPGGRGEERGEDNEELVREVRKVRDELHDLRREVGRIADALEDESGPSDPRLPATAHPERRRRPSTVSRPPSGARWRRASPREQRFVPGVERQHGVEAHGRGGRRRDPSTARRGPTTAAGPANHRVAVPLA